MASFTTTRRVEFCDTDAAGIMHFSAFFTMMEQAEHELLRSVGLSVIQQDAEGVVSWPRVAVNCEFRGAARFEDVLDIDVTIGRLGQKSVTYVFQISLAGHIVAEGKITAVCCRLHPDQPMESIPIPAQFRERLGKYVVPQVRPDDSTE